MSHQHQRIIALTAENFKRLVAVTIHPTGSLVEITGRNNQGKSSCLDAIEACLGGAKHSPDRPIRNGQSHARVVVETEELIVTRTWSESDDGEKINDRLKIESKSGGVIRKPQDLLNSLIGGASFDPLAFSRMKPKEQAERLREIVGLDTSELDAERQRVYDERTAVNREVVKLKGRLSGMPEVDVPDAPPAEIDATDLIKEFEVANAKRLANNLARQNANRLDELIADRRQQLALVSADIAKLERQRAELAVAERSMVDPDIDPIRLKIDRAKTHNDKVRQVATARATALAQANARDQAEQELRDAERISAMHSDRLAEIDREKAAMVAAAKFPVPGLSFADDGTVLLNGVPFSQASSSQQIKVGMALGAALNPGIRTLLIRDGSLLDNESLAAVAAFAESAGMQVFVERVGEGAGGIVIEDGVVKGNESPAVRG